MSEIDIIRQIAQQVLTVTTLAGISDNWLWDRAQRLVRNAEHICRLPELTDANLAVDRFCLITAAYFADAGFAHYADAEDTGARLVLAASSIIEAGDRFTEMTEAMILSDARNLDDMGSIGIFNEFRRYVIHGKGASDVLQSWKRKVDYKYWQARLKESFRFESVRTLAEQRYSATEYFMNQLEVENSARDLEELIIESLDNKTADQK